MNTTKKFQIITKAEDQYQKLKLKNIIKVKSKSPSIFDNLFS